MVRAIVFAAIIALVAMYSRETVAKTPVNPSIAEPAIAKHTKDIDDNRWDARLHHRGGRSPGDNVGYSGGGGSHGHHKSSSTESASGRHRVQVGKDNRTRSQLRFSRSQLPIYASTSLVNPSTKLGTRLNDETPCYRRANPNL